MKPVTAHDHPEHHWVWTEMELSWIAERDAQWQARLDAAVAAERERCAKVCKDAWEIDGTYTAAAFAERVLTDHLT